MAANLWREEMDQLRLELLLRMLGFQQDGCTWTKGPERVTIGVGHVIWSTGRLIAALRPTSKALRAAEARAEAELATSEAADTEK